MVKHAWKLLQESHHKILKVCLTIFQYYAWKVKITAWFIKLQVGWPIGKLFHGALYHSCSKHFRQISKKQPQELFFLKKIAGYRASLMKKGSFSLEFFLGIVLWLTRFSLMPHVYTTWKPQKSFGFLMFSGGLEMEHWIKIGEL